MLKVQIQHIKTPSCLTSPSTPLSSTSVGAAEVQVLRQWVRVRKILHQHGCDVELEAGHSIRT